MKFITCAGYYGTGSSAVTDLVSEFDNVHSFSNEEFRFIHDTDGISDLEYHLIENFNRHNSGHAIKRYKRMVDYFAGNFLFKRYEKLFGGNWKKLSYEYIGELTDFTYHGWWHYDLIDGGKFFHFRKRFLEKILHATVWKKQPLRVTNALKKEITYCGHPSQEKFISVTKKYIEDLFGSACNHSEIVMVDQLVASTNISHYLRYFNDIKVILVDRDPRDIFLLEKYCWKAGIIPSELETYCKWFEYTRAHRKTENVNTDNICFIHFEDLIYHYEETVAMLAEWLDIGVENHVKKKEIFRPDVSINNTQLWKKIPCNMEEVHYIEDQLKEYLYQF